MQSHVRNAVNHLRWGLTSSCAFFCSEFIFISRSFLSYHLSKSCVVKVFLCVSGTMDLSECVKCLFFSKQSCKFTFSLYRVFHCFASYQIFFLFLHSKNVKFKNLHTVVVFIFLAHTESVKIMFLNSVTIWIQEIKVNKASIGDFIERQTTSIRKKKFVSRLPIKTKFF